VDALVRLGVPCVFTTTGVDAALPLLAAAGRQPWPLVRARSDTAAVVMAAVTGELRGVPGVVLLEDRPVVAGLSNGLGQALVDRRPLIVITGRSAGAAPVPPGSATKASLTLTAESAAHGIAQAAHLALTHPRGPVHVELPSDVARAAALPRATPFTPPTLPPPSSEDVDRAAAMIAASVRPVVVAGGQTRSRDEAEWVRAFAEALPAPVVTMPRARGVVPEPHPLALGVVGVNGVVPTVLRRADLVVALGLDPVERFAPPTPAPWLHLTPADRTEPGGPGHVVVGEISLILAELAPRLRQGTRADWDVVEVDGYRRALAAEGAESPRAGRLRELVALVRQRTPAGSIAVFDRGVLAGAPAWQCVSPFDLVCPGPPGLEGFAIPAAIAARLLSGDRAVLCFTDVAGLTTAMGDLATAAEARLGVVTIVVNDTDAPIEPFTGVPGVVRLETTGAGSVGPALAQALAVRGPSLIDVRQATRACPRPV
jgi:acetolactate synthase I/II/III large subunit